MLFYLVYFGSLLFRAALSSFFFFFFNDTATTEIYTLSYTTLFRSLSCVPDPSGALTCFDSNLDDDGGTVFAFHAARRCVAPDLDHTWIGTHGEINFLHPADTLADPRNDGFVRVNDATEQPDNGTEGPFEDETMGYYDQRDIPLYYALAQDFAISDR